MENMRFDFSVNNEGEIEDVSPYSDTTEERCEEVLQSFLDDNEIELGERSEGNISIENNIVTLDYRVCTELGEDWDSDVWEDVNHTIHLTN